MKTKTILIIILIASALPLTSQARWGRKKTTKQQEPQNAYSILLDSKQQRKTVTLQPAVTPAAEKQTSAQQFTTAHTLLTNADKAKASEQFGTAVQLYDKAIKTYIALQVDYPDWQPKVTKFHLNHCIYHLNSLIKQAEAGKIQLVAERTPLKAKPSRQKSSSSLKQAQALLLQNRTKDARNVLIDALMADPDNKQTRLLIGIVQCKLQQYNDATYLLETLIKEYPGDADAHVILSVAYFGLNRDKDTIAQLQQALTIDAFHKEANFNMARTLLKAAPHKTDDIKKYYIKAVELGAPRVAELDAALLKR